LTRKKSVVSFVGGFQILLQRLVSDTANYLDMLSLPCR